ncbi:N-acetylmuramoyl-L-alanine amidase [Candidatus Saccharibacteria bacterium]|nr:N-acetylmuramoyl-L-alanine amidase [Candidatus Saccharibacteria bacterium]
MNTRQYNKHLFLNLILTISFVITTPTNAFSATNLRTFSANSIYFYDECTDAIRSPSIGSIATASGSTADEKIWSALKSLGLSDELSAGILGNIHNEGGASPVRREGCYGTCSDDGYDWEHDPSSAKGLGLIQWSFGRRVNLIKHLRDKGAGSLVDKYILNNVEKYAGLNGDEFIEAVDDPADANTLFALEMDFLLEEIKNEPSYQSVLDQKTVAEAAEEFSIHVEACGECTQRGSAENQERIAAAEQMYTLFTGKIAFSNPGGHSSSSSSSTCGCYSRNGGYAASNISFDDEGWITGGIDEYIKDEARGRTISPLDSSGYQSFATEMPNGKGAGPNKITLHSVEGPGDNSNTTVLPYFHSSDDNMSFPPHFTIDVKNRKVYQHFPIYQTSTAVMSHDNTAGVQIEIMGYSDAALARSRGYSQWILSEYSDTELEYIADLLRGISKATGIPLTSTADWSGDASYTPRLSATEFASYQGIIGHRQVPNNTHWDPHGLWDNLQKVLESAPSTPSETSSNDNTSSSNSSQIKNDGENITIIGDSITEGSKQAIIDILPNADIHAKSSKVMFGSSDANNQDGKTIVDNLIKENELREIVVIALGTNDGVLNKDKVQQLVDTINDSGLHNIVFVNNFGYGRSDNQDYSENNEIFTAIKNTNSNVIIADWASVAKADPEKYIAKDGLGVHPTNPDGVNLFAKTIYDTIIGNFIDSVSYGSSCSGSHSSGNLNKLQATVKRFAWPDYHSKPFTKRMPDYIEAIEEGGYHGDDCHGGGVDCGAFVYQVITKSGWDPEYGGGTGTTTAVQDWMKGAGASSWENVTNRIKSNKDAKPGDVILSSSHALLFVGDIPGFNGVMASASQCGRAPMADSAEDISSYVSSGYEVWRKK